MINILTKKGLKILWQATPYGECEQSRSTEFLNNDVEPYNEDVNLKYKTILLVYCGTKLMTFDKHQKYLLSLPNYFN